MSRRRPVRPAPTVPVVPTVPKLSKPAGDTPSTKPLVHIGMTVLEIEFDDLPKVTETIKREVPWAKIDNQTYELGTVQKPRYDKLIRSLSHHHHATVVSRPQIMTISGETATIQVGQQVDLRVASDPNAVSTEEIGLSVKCTPKVLPDAKSLHAHLEIGNAQLAVSGDGNPTILRGTASYALELKDGVTIGVEGRSEGKMLILFLTPTINPQKNGAFRTAQTEKKERPPAESDLMTDLGRIEKAINKVAPGSITELSLKDGEVEFEAALKSSDVVPDIAQAITELGLVELRTMRISALGSGFKLQANGIVHRASHTEELKPLPPVSPVSSSPTCQKLKQTIAELYPNDKVMIRELNSSVLIRGEVSAHTRDMIISIAEDFFPRVIDDLKVTARKTSASNRPNPPAADYRPAPSYYAPNPYTPSPYAPNPSTPRPPQTRATTPPVPRPVYPSPAYVPNTVTVTRGAKSASKLDNEIRELRGEVKMLRADVKKLIEMLEKRVGNIDDRNDAFENDTAKSPTPKNILTWTSGTRAYQDWDLRLADVVAIAKRNVPEGDPNKVRKAFEALNLARLRHASVSKGLDSNKLVDAYQQAGHSEQFGVGLRRAAAAKSKAYLEMLQSERELRKLMGMAEKDGRLITPIVK